MFMDDIFVARLSPNNSSYIATDTGFSTALWCYVWPLIFAVGVCGNTLIMFVTWRGDYVKTSASVYLFLLAGADNSVLAFGFLDGFVRHAWDVAITDSGPFMCRLIWFLQPAFASTAIWILVAFTVERFMGICFPVRPLQSPRQVYTIAAILMVVAMLKNTDTLFTIAPRDDDTYTCRVASQFVDYEDYVRPWIGFTFTSLLPFMAVLYCNIMIIRALRNRATTDLVPPVTDQHVAQTTVMCVSVSFVFLLCYTPGSIIYLVSRYLRYSNPAFRAVEHDTLAVTACLRYVHHSANIFLYCLTGVQFREDLLALFGGAHDNKVRHYGTGVTNRPVVACFVVKPITSIDKCITLA